ncbi:CD276 antigen-like [Sander lucioperca]|uniref:CD276 antigen-like n=1 Tax=Sander lucioperca TaxID=283035 RepID=UPI0016539352|nr:CD276 antigen-like [Sander lucioperca]
MELLPLLCLCLLTRSGITSAQLNGPPLIKVEQDRDVVLPCSLSTKENIASGVFDWKKVAQKDAGEKEVFLYDKGKHYNDGRDGQSEQFKGRVSHFQDELKHGNASIIIRNTKISDSGNYTCYFPHLRPPQTFYIELVVGAAPKPSVATLDETKDWSLLQCEVHGNPEPEVEWQDSDGTKLPAEKPQVKQIGNIFYITLNVTVTKSDRYRCVATQETISHQISAETYVQISGTLQLSVKIVSETNDRALLQCEVRGASADLRVEWQDSAGNQLAAKEPQLSERGGGYDVTLQTTVTKTGHYHCVASQKKSNHTISEDTFVHISGEVFIFKI